MNTIPFVLLGVLISLKNHQNLFKVSIFIVIAGGLGVWIFGRPAFHAGASGLIFGYFGFLLARGWNAKDFGSVAIAIITVFFYGGMFLGILPVQTYISWESHLFGFIAGIMANRQFSTA
jgi:membrane associated rhomboid family serine protease